MIVSSSQEPVGNLPQRVAGLLHKLSYQTSLMDKIVHELINVGTVKTLS
jgi:hypothetical protein